MNRILFISRAYPPIVGGIEMQNFGIGRALSEITETKIIANKKGKKNLPVFLLRLFFLELFRIASYDAVIFGDGVLSPVGVWWKFFYPKKKFLSIIHGLDVTYAYKNSLMGKIYKFVNIPCHKKMDKLIMVGNETITQAVKVGIPRDLCQFIPNGLDVDEICAIPDRKRVEELLGGIDLSGRKIIFRAGRFVKHKGVAWFVRNVMPLLNRDYIFIAAGPNVSKKTAGDECDFDSAELAMKELGLEKNVYLLTKLSREDLKILFNSCDLYVSPNIKVPGSMEGFGITAIEAGACGRIVLAADLEGLKDAIINNENGFLVEPENAKDWSEKINKILSDDIFRKEFSEKAKKYVENNYSWKIIGKKYFEVIEQTLS